MRRKKHKHTKRIVAFYKLNYGFREPFKVLLDGNFVHATLAFDLSNLEKHISELLGGPVRLFTTRCVMSELASLGPDYRGTAAAARRHALHKCSGHKDPVAAADCLLAQLGPSNGEHWWIATQDRLLQASCALVAGTPVIYTDINGIHVEEPSAASKASAKQVQEQAMAPQMHERAAEVLREAADGGGWGRVHTNVRFKRNKAKGPNPLAVKKKTKPQTARPQAGANPGGGGRSKGEDAAAATTKAAKRKRKRSKSAGSGGGPGVASLSDD